MCQQLLSNGSKFPLGTGINAVDLPRLSTAQDTVIGSDRIPHIKEIPEGKP
ncbi:hypothetical protein D3C85_1685090 [compost metagenome]